MNKLTLAVLLFLALPAQAKEFQPQVGDILFQDLDCGDFCDAIEKVTEGIDGWDFSHMGLVDQKDGKWIVYEARGVGVVASDYHEFIKRGVNAKGNPKILVGRLKKGYAKLVPEGIRQVRQLLGKPYDPLFVIDNDKYYCSEMIHLAFKRANSGKAIFKEEPMTFKDPDTKEFFPIWVDYFEKLGAKIPEGAPGLNPGGMSRSKALTIVYNYENPQKELENLTRRMFGEFDYPIVMSGAHYQDSEFSMLSDKDAAVYNRLFFRLGGTFFRAGEWGQIATYRKIEYPTFWGVIIENYVAWGGSWGQSVFVTISKQGEPLDSLQLSQSVGDELDYEIGTAVVESPHQIVRYKTVGKGGQKPTKVIKETYKVTTEGKLKHLNSKDISL